MAEIETLQWLAPTEATRPNLLFDFDGIDLGARRFDRRAIERVNPHRGEMSLLDWIVWASDDFARGVALTRIRPGGLFGAGSPDAVFPEVLLIDAGAQLACYLYNSRAAEPKHAAFLRLENAEAGGPVRVGDDLYILCSEVKFGRRRFVADVQGLVGGRVVFGGRITGMGV